ncbi:MAG: RnfH family protein [Pseudomonadales bacterium]|jgi:putative ubiquitin-RnfH superfamily antitoxin RatB of RatAB toxin-antitoxin module
MHVEVVYALPEHQHRLHLELDAGATVADALRAVQRIPPFDALALEDVPVGIFGRLVSRQQVLGAGDRVEIYRPLKVDPKEARRRRALQPDPAADG